MRVIVCGGRGYADREAVAKVIAALDERVIIVHGGARGADSLAHYEGSARGLNAEVWPADWNKHGRAAGPIRNQQMLAAGADLVIAFPGGRGTGDMVERARKAGVPVLEVSA